MTWTSEPWLVSLNDAVPALQEKIQHDQDTPLRRSSPPSANSCVRSHTPAAELPSSVPWLLWAQSSRSCQIFPRLPQCTDGNLRHTTSADRFDSGPSILKHFCSMHRHVLELVKVADNDGFSTADNLLRSSYCWPAVSGTGPSGILLSARGWEVLRRLSIHAMPRVCRREGESAWE